MGECQRATTSSGIQEVFCSWRLDRMGLQAVTAKDEDARVESGERLSLGASFRTDPVGKVRAILRTAGKASGIERAPPNQVLVYYGPKAVERRRTGAIHTK